MCCVCESVCVCVRALIGIQLTTKYLTEIDKLQIKVILSQWP